MVLQIWETVVYTFFGCFSKLCQGVMDTTISMVQESYDKFIAGKV